MNLILKQAYKTTEAHLCRCASVVYSMFCLNFIGLFLKFFEDHGRIVTAEAK